MRNNKTFDGFGQNLLGQDFAVGEGALNSFMIFLTPEIPHYWNH